jgi:hypothetical protein
MWAISPVGNQVRHTGTITKGWLKGVGAMPVARHMCGAVSFLLGDLKCV